VHSSVTWTRFSFFAISDVPLDGRLWRPASRPGST
jgi:hypothetical protein